MAGATHSLEPIVLHVFPEIRPGGGPSGYGFNLQRALATYTTDTPPIRILAPKQYAIGKPQKVSWRFNLLRKVPRGLAAYLLLARYWWASKNVLRIMGFSPNALEEVRSAQVLVFHDFRLARAYLSSIGRQPKQKVLIMPHSPTDLSAEIVENWRSSLGPSPVWAKVHRTLAEVEFQALLSCDGILVPCVHSLASYFSDDSKKREQLLSLRIYEVLSGVEERRAFRSREEVLTSLGISPDRKVIGFFGRYHPHKGYDLFSQAAQLAHQSGDQELFFVSAGSGPLASPKGLPNYKDLGYVTSGLGDLLAAVDLVVVPNRVHYFDLLVLEALSLGKVVLTSPVGGALCLKAPGIFLLEEISPNSLYLRSKSLLANPSSMAKLGAANRQVYLEKYTLERFAERHILLAHELLNQTL